jgi:hypothetical protein
MFAPPQQVIEELATDLRERGLDAGRFWSPMRLDSFDETAIELLLRHAHHVGDRGARRRCAEALVDRDPGHLAALRVRVADADLRDPGELRAHVAALASAAAAAGDRTALGVAEAARGVLALPWPAWREGETARAWADRADASLDAMGAEVRWDEVTGLLVGDATDWHGRDFVVVCTEGLETAARRACAIAALRARLAGVGEETRGGVLGSRAWSWAAWSGASLTPAARLDLGTDVDPTFTVIEENADALAEDMRRLLAIAPGEGVEPIECLDALLDRLDADGLGEPRFATRARVASALVVALRERGEAEHPVAEPDAAMLAVARRLVRGPAFSLRVQVGDLVPDAAGAGGRTLA